MTDDADIVDRAVDFLEAARLDVEREAGRLRVARSGTGDEPVALETATLVDELADNSDIDRALAAWAKGVKFALLEPAGSPADDWDFAEAAGRLVASIDAETYELGVEQAVGSAPWTLDLADDLVVDFLLELDSGMRPVRETDVDRWGVSEDRMISGARSMLFHKAQQTAPIPVEDHPPVERLRVGDGYDAARAFVVEDLFFGEIDQSSRLAMPTSDHLLFVRDPDDGDVDALRRAAEEVCDETDYPLSRELFRISRGQPVPVGG